MGGAQGDWETGLERDDTVEQRLEGNGPEHRRRKLGQALVGAKEAMERGGALLNDV